MCKYDLVGSKAQVIFGESRIHLLTSLLKLLQLRDLNLGTQFPTIKGLEVADSKIDADTGLLESLDLALDLHYSGNFQLSIDVKMLLGKTAYMALQGITSSRRLGILQKEREQRCIILYA